MKNHDLKLEQHMFSSISSVPVFNQLEEKLFLHVLRTALDAAPLRTVRVCAAARQRFSPMAATERRMGLDRLLGGVYHVYK